MTDEAGDICDLEGRVLLLNQAFEQLYGWKRKEILGKSYPLFRRSFVMNLTILAKNIRWDKSPSSSNH
ncbi:PAS domain-containing protein [Bacillus sp. N9]